MTLNPSILWLIVPFFIWKIYQYRKAIWHSMNFYGNYISKVMEEKVDEKKKK